MPAARAATPSPSTLVRAAPATGAGDSAVFTGRTVAAGISRLGRSILRVTANIQFVTSPRLVKSKGASSFETARSAHLGMVAAISL